MNRLRTLRNVKGLTQQQVADDLGIDRVLYSRYESGARKPPIENLKLLSSYFNVSIDYLLENEVVGNDATASPVSALDALPPDLRAKAEDYIAMLKLLDESRKKDSTPTGTDDIPKHA